LTVVLMAVPADRTDIVSPALSTMPLLVTPELTTIFAILVPYPNFLLAARRLRPARRRLSAYV
jgi:hypothetical protein